MTSKGELQYFDEMGVLWIGDTSRQIDITKDINFKIINQTIGSLNKLSLVLFTTISSKAMAATSKEVITKRTTMTLKDLQEREVVQNAESFNQLLYQKIEKLFLNSLKERSGGITIYQMPPIVQVPPIVQMPPIVRNVTQLIPISFLNKKGLKIEIIQLETLIQVMKEINKKFDKLLLLTKIGLIIYGFDVFSKIIKKIYNIIIGEKIQKIDYFLQLLRILAPVRSFYIALRLMFQKFMEKVRKNENALKILKFIRSVWESKSNFSRLMGYIILIMITILAVFFLKPQLNYIDYLI